jgi:hypothetical protein
MKLQGSGQQGRDDPLYRADGSVLVGATAQLVLARSISRTFLLLQNTSPGPLWFEFGCGNAVATISGGKVTVVTANNAGFGYTRPPLVLLQGGGGGDVPNGNTSYLGLGQPGALSPTNFAKAHAVLTSGAISSIVVDSQGSGYLCAPYVHIMGDPLDPNGAAAPAAGSGVYLAANSAPLTMEATFCTTDAVTVFGATAGQTFNCRWAS